ncbi:hypothetical protein EW146_g7613 [Bondarzewia mesenterica]|uniref:Pali-domain-containing protein n=1 Tax=Bondarzewia mesenterica TaxID=1095465 RepID=A0A4S4LKG7_9AGAM|nr:hypothetical protein EW146_g7613 [Bondarzewia mesenterica]
MACFRRRPHYDEDYHNHHQHHQHHHHHHARRHPLHTFSTTFFLFCAFILFLLVALSLPIIKPIYLLTINAIPVANQPVTSIGTELRFGVWGFCVTSALNPPTLLTNSGDCVGPRLGYTISPDILALIGNANLLTVILKGLTVLLVLHPVAAGLAFLTFFLILCTCCISPFVLWILSLLVGIVTAIVSSVVLAADLALVIVARSKVKDVTLGTFTVSFGNGVWMMVAAVALIWLCVILLSVRVSTVLTSQSRKYDDRY